MQLRRSCIALATLLFLVCSLCAQSPHSAATGAGLSIMPLPSHAEPGNGEFLIVNGFAMVFNGYTEPRLERARQRFLDTLQAETGIRRWPASRTLPQFVIDTKGASAPVQQLGEDESYRLEVTPARVSLIASNPLGVLHGLQTFLQLVHITPRGFAVESILIEDKPRFPWRGLMIDSGRHFMPVAVIRQNLDAMEAVKLNILHWHVSEDQGFRIESKLFPRLTGLGSDGLFYSQNDVRKIIDYARDRGIRVMPEFELPSHAASLFVGYPRLADGEGPYRIKHRLGQPWDRKRDPAEDSSMDPTRESTYVFLNSLIGEMSSLFPDAYLHVGGDAEDAILEWAANPRMKQYMREHHYKDSAALQGYFTDRLQKIVARHHKTMVGWDEVLQPDTPHDVVIQSWRGLDALATTVSRGNRGILSWGYYLDLNEPASRHYAVDPLDDAVAKLPPEQQKLVLGGEANMWSEYVSPETIDGRIWPRAAVVAERLWSPREVMNMESMYARLAILSQHLTDAGLPSAERRERALHRMAGNADVSSLRVLASVVEPPKGYPRGGHREFTVYTPLNHLADIVPAEADSARKFREIASRIANGRASSADLQQARQWLTLWRDNDATLQPILRQSALTQELVSLSRNLSEAARIGLRALDQLEGHKLLDPETTARDLGTLKELNVPVAELTIMTIPGIEILLSPPRP